MYECCAHVWLKLRFRHLNACCMNENERKRYEPMYECLALVRFTNVNGIWWKFNGWMNVWIWFSNFSGVIPVSELSIQSSILSIKSFVKSLPYFVCENGYVADMYECCAHVWILRACMNTVHTYMSAARMYNWNLGLSICLHVAWMQSYKNVWMFRFSFVYVCECFSKPKRLYIKKRIHVSIKTTGCIPFRKYFT